MAVRICKHGVKVAKEPGHDCTYADARDALIPLAEKHAYEVAGPRPKVAGGGRNIAFEEWTARWNRAYHARMDELWSVRLAELGTQQAPAALAAVAA